MSSLSNSKIPAPQDWKHFQDICRDLWSEIWGDPNAQVNGREGQAQNGVDISGVPKGGSVYVGVQCKCIDINRALEESELDVEVEKAKGFFPPLSVFIVATTGKKDAVIEEYARKITESHKTQNLFKVVVFAWEDIQKNLASFRDIYKKHYPDFFVEPPGLDTTLKSTLSTDASTNNSLVSSSNRHFVTIHPEDGTLVPEYQAELDVSKGYLKQYKPKQTIEYLNILKNRIWHSAPPKVKFRILSQMGQAHLILGNESESAKSYIEAFQYDSANEGAMTNAAFGYFLLNQFDKAQEFAKKALSANPVNTNALAILINSATSVDEAEKVIASIPEKLKQTTEIAYAISLVAKNARNGLKEIKELETALENTGGDSVDLRGALAEAILRHVLSDKTVFAGQVNPENKILLAKGLENLNRAWEQVSGSEMAKERTDWLANRSTIKRFLGDLEGSSRDLDFALSLNPENSSYKRYKSLLLFNKGDFSNAEKLLKECLGKVEGAEFLLAVVLKEEKKYSEAIGLLENFLKTENGQKLFKEIKRVLIDLYLESGDRKKAEVLANSYKDLSKPNVSELVEQSHFYRNINDCEKADEILMKAKLAAGKDEDIDVLVELIHELSQANKNQAAIEILETISNPAIYSDLTELLLKAYLDEGLNDKALALCLKLIEGSPPNRRLTSIAARIYESIGNLPAAKDLVEKYLVVRTEDTEMKIQLGGLCLKIDDGPGVDKILDSGIDALAVDYRYSLKFISLLALRSRFKEAIETMYELRKKNFQNPEAHLKYIGLIIDKRKNQVDILDVSEVGVGSAVCIEKKDHSKSWYIIETDERADISRNEIKQTNPLAKELLGKTVGAEVTLNDNQYSKETGTICDIQSKYVRAFQESLENFEKWFPGAPGLKKIIIEESEPGTETLKALDPVLRQVDQSTQNNREILNYYQQGKLTIGAVSHFIHLDIFNTWWGLTRMGDVGVKCYNGNEGDLAQVLEVLNQNKPTVVIDLISILTIDALDIKEKIVEGFGKFAISQSTLEELFRYKSELESTKSEGFLSLGKINGEYTRMEVSSETIKDTLDRLSKLIEWVKANTIVLPCNEALKIPSRKKKEFDDLLGDFSFETILISKEKSGLFYSDDYFLRAVGIAEFGVTGVWTQALLLFLFSKGKIEKEEYLKATVALCKMNYQFVSVEIETLTYSLSQADWAPNEDFKAVLKMYCSLPGNYLIVLQGLASFIFEIWKLQILPIRRDEIIYEILNASTDKKDVNTVVSVFKRFVREKFRLLPLDEAKMFSVIDGWHARKVKI